MTGATGFIGSNLLQGLTSRGHMVLGLVRSLPNDLQLADEKNLKKINCFDSVSELAAALSGCESLVHCLGHSGKGWQRMNRSTIWYSNVDVAQRLIDACVIAGVKKIIFFSTIHVYGDSLKGVEPVSSESPVFPRRSMQNQSMLQNQSSGK